jgi:DNA-binding IclR family transcriptional regulator
MLLTIESAARVLALFDTEGPERGVTEVASTLGLSRSKAHTLLASLAEVGLLRRTAHGRYRLGWMVIWLNRVLAETTDFQRFARPVMELLAGRYGEVVQLVTLDAGEVLYVDRVCGAQAVPLNLSAVGNRLPAHCSAVGKALLAQLQRAQLAQILEERPLTALTERTITERAVLDDQLEQIRRCGYATAVGEVVSGVACAAAPIIGPGPKVVAALSLSAPRGRFAEREAVYCHAVVKAAQHVSKNLVRTEHDPSFRAPIRTRSHVQTRESARSAAGFATLVHSAAFPTECEIAI